MGFCRNCGYKLNEGAKFCPNCGQPVEAQTVNRPIQQPQYVVQPVQQPQERKPLKPDSGMLFAVLSTLFCCLPTGIVAIIKANDVDKLYFAGDYKGAEDAANSARTWTYVGIGIAVVGWLIYIIFFFLLGIGGALN